jgi:hypothetical protein
MPSKVLPENRNQKDDIFATALSDDISHIRVTQETNIQNTAILL